ncbi:Predicted thiol-disulfide oxidoreductase YuxK, DCC family [Actinopolyspora alba]|uniref:Predicted thiol-disulfide oxidoreductase YuxK, DCC family n=1 Tax=Actinopolyspora alba TaxID=673379 RepID=A0A1I2C6N7_9ACTN|nr:DCC1-like thiol-disulfide oxidoreductase family protein [Actinopolyspora alba]SFE63503.1 Predicted thiol-disulfide oxidoreductase YuxK, DCC family [Actinopolyspora alba]
MTESRSGGAQPPYLIFDGDCGFCSRVIELLGRWVTHPAVVASWQTLDLDRFGVTRERANHEILWIDTDGTVSGGSVAFGRYFAAVGGRFRPLAFLLLHQPTRWVAARLYELVARNRHRMPGGTASCSLPR